MKPRLHPAQAAWLAEIGLDLHWLDVRPIAPAAGGAPQPAAEQGGARIVRDGTADRPSAPAAPLAVGGSAQAATAAPQPVAGASVRPATHPPGPSADLAPTPAIAPGLPLRDADLAALAGMADACRQCARHQQRLRAVPGAGQADHPYYLIVAEQPGIDDEVAGQPFQGDSGRLLSAMLAAVRLPQADSRYGTYVMKCRALGGREPDAAEIAACAPYLHREIALLQPRWILALGRVAAQAVLGDAADLDALRGAAQRYRQEDGREIPVWVTHQPASLLVRSALKAEAWRDLAGLAQAVRAADPGK